MWLNQASGLALNSAANSLPARSGTPKIPLLVEPSYQAKTLIKKPLSPSKTHFHQEKCVFSLTAGRLREIRSVGIGIAPAPPMT
jgi:hypothetical protein